MLLGLIQNDASLLSCRMQQLKGIIKFESEIPPDAVGAGYVDNGQALVRRRPGTSPVVASGILDLVADVKATGLLIHVRHATIGGFKDENTHPFRYRNWLFAHQGTVAGFGDLRPKLLDDLPPFLQRMVVGETDSEHVFAIFLDEISRNGAIDAINPNPQALGSSLLHTIERVESLCEGVGAPNQSSLNIVATNGRCMVACHYGKVPEISYTEFGGLDECVLHDLPIDAPDTHSQRIPHRNMRSLVVATRVDPEALPPWTPIPIGQVLAVGPDLSPHICG